MDDRPTCSRLTRRQPELGRRTKAALYQAHYGRNRSHNSAQERALHTGLPEPSAVLRRVGVLIYPVGSLAVRTADGPCNTARRQVRLLLPGPAERTAASRPTGQSIFTPGLREVHRPLDATRHYGSLLRPAAATGRRASG